MTERLTEAQIELFEVFWRKGIPLNERRRLEGLPETTLPALQSRRQALIVESQQKSTRGWYGLGKEQLSKKT